MLAQVAHLEARLGVVLEDGSAERVRAQAALEDASALIELETGQSWDETTVPAAVRTVCLQAASRVYRNPASVISRTSADFTESWGRSGTKDTADGIYLTDAERSILARFATTTGSTGVWSVDTTADRVLAGNGLWLTDGYGGDPIRYADEIP